MTVNLIIVFSVRIFPETKTCKHFQYRKGSLFLQSSGYVQIKHNGTSSVLVQTMSANHASVSHFPEAILHQKKLLFLSFGCAL